MCHFLCYLIAKIVYTLSEKPQCSVLNIVTSHFTFEYIFAPIVINVSYLLLSWQVVFCKSDIYDIM